MITDLQNFFLKHNKWLFSALLIVIIVTFVLTIGNQSFFGGGQSFERERAEYYGYDLNNRADTDRLLRHGEISLQLDPFMQFDPGLGSAARSLEEYAILRVSALGLANRIGIPDPTDQQLRQHIEGMGMFQNASTGGFDATRYNEYMNQIRQMPGLDEGTLARVLRDDWRISRIRSALAGPGYVLPFEARSSFAQRETDWVLEVATFPLDAFGADIQPSEDSLRSYYEQNPGQYTIPERIRVSAVFFDAENFIERTEMPSDAVIEDHFNRFQFRYQRAQSSVEIEAPPEVTLDEVRDEVVRDIRQESAREIAQIQSDAFANFLYNEEIARHSEAFEAAVQEFGGELRTLEPFARGQAPADTGIPPRVLQSAWTFASSINRYFSDLSETESGAALVVVDELIPEHHQDFETVRQDVEADFTAEERRRLFAAQAQEWEESLKAAVASGSDFAEAARNLGFAVQTTDTFRPATLPQSVEPRVWDSSRHLAEGETSDAIIDDQGAHFAHVLERSSPPTEIASDELADFSEQIREQRASTSGWFALREWRDDSLSTIRPMQTPL